MSQKSIGKHTRTAFYIHVSQLSTLSKDVQESIVKSLDKAGLGEDSEFNVIKISHDLSSISFLNYPDFFSKGFPVLEHSWHVDLKLNTCSFRTYANSMNPPILHRKELLLSSDHPEIDQFQKLTQEAENLNLFNDPSRIGFLNQWTTLIRSKGYRVEDHQFVPIEVDEGTESDNSNKDNEFEKLSELDTEVQRHKTALVRYGFSLPMLSLMRFGFLDGRYSVFDYGCGRGDDLRGLIENNIDAHGWDPHFKKDHPKIESDIVNLGFVLNVIEDFKERVEAMQGAYSLARGLLVIAVIIENNNSSLGKTFRDGIITKKETFQKYFTPNEIKDFVEENLQEEVVAVAPGVYFVFKDKIIEQDFLLNRVRSSSSYYRKRLNLPPRLTRKERDDAKYAQHKELLDSLWNEWIDLGRDPIATEVKNVNFLKKEFGTLGKALRFLRSQKDEQVLKKAYEIKKNDLLVFLALEMFKQRTAFSDMSASFQRDIKVFFGNITNARNSAQDLLFQIADYEEIELKCEQASSEGLGLIRPKKSLQLHTSLVERLPALLRVYVGCATVLYGDVTSADLVKIHIQSGKISLMRYDDFAGKAIPQLLERVKIDFRKQKLELFEYGDEYQPQNLYQKSIYMNEEMFGYAEQCTFDELLEEIILFDFREYGPGPKEFLYELEKKRWQVEGLSLVRAKSIPDIEDECGENYSYRDLIECGETQKKSGIENLPKNPDSFTALLELTQRLLDPIIDYFGPIELTFGFCSPELAKLITGRIAPKLDQHAAHELNRNGKYICSRLGAAVDFIVEDEDMFEVAKWISDELDFDRLYIYGKKNPIHLSFGPEMKNQITLMKTNKDGTRLIPRKIDIKSFSESY